MAAYKLNVLAIEFLLSQGAEINSKDNYGCTPLHYIFFDDQKCELIEVAKILLFNGVDVNSTDNDGNTVLHRAAHRGLFEIDRLLLNNKAEINLKNKQNVIPLINALYQKNYEVAKFRY